MTRTHLSTAVRILGSNSALARAIGLTRQGVSKALRTGIVSPSTAIAVESATQGAVTRHMLRPDFFGEAAANG